MSFLRLLFDWCVREKELLLRERELLLRERELLLRERELLLRERELLLSQLSGSKSSISLLILFVHLALHVLGEE
jgi:hypothetical protein